MGGRRVGRRSRIPDRRPQATAATRGRNSGPRLESLCVDLKVLIQPYRESASAQTFLTTALEDPEVSEVLILTAWLRRSGLDLLIPGLEALRQRNGTSRLLFGVDLLGTSRQAVALAKQHVTDLRVVHDPSARTFHPKMYLARGERTGYAAIGSNNLTAGGLWHNYEGAVTAVFDPRREREISDGIERFARRLANDVAICKPVTRHVFSRLVNEGWLVDEDKNRQHRSEDRPGVGRRTSRPGLGRTPLFAPSKLEKRDSPAPTRKGAAKRIGRTTRRQVAMTPDSWWKQLGAGDAQRPPTGHRTGNITLTQVPPGQDRERFFRTVFFGGERWGRRGTGPKRTEFITIDTHVALGRRDLGNNR